MAYREPHRAYHTAQHINECLDLLDWCTQEFLPIGSPDHLVLQPTLEIALWYHDVVYQPQLSDNERRSAEQAAAFFLANDVAPELIDQVTSLIMTTCHLNSPNSIAKAPAELADWMVDIDLAILGASPQRFTQYESQIHQEYDWIPESMYRLKRKAVLAEFLGRSNIYQSVIFQQRFECQALRNLSSIVSINSLS